MKKHIRYQDYVIQDGRLVGEFDEMYRDFDDPWEQGLHEHVALEKSIGIELLKKYGHKRPLEYGCGLGHYTARLQREFGSAAGVDISETAIAKAKLNYPDPAFFVSDILNSSPLEAFKPDSLIFAEITWYVLESLSNFKSLISKSLKSRGFLHLLTTYPPGEQSYGVEYFTNLSEIMNYWSDVIDIMEWGLVSKSDAGGASRSFFYGQIK